MFLVWCSLKIDSDFFAIKPGIKPFGFSVLAATENESAQSFDTNVTLVFEKFKRREVEKLLENKNLSLK